MNSKKIFNIIGVILIPLILVVVLVNNQSNLFKGFLSTDITESDGLTIDQASYINTPIGETDSINLFSTDPSIQGAELEFTNEVEGNKITAEIKDSAGTRVAFTNKSENFASGDTINFKWDGKTCGTYSRSTKTANLECTVGNYDLILRTHQDTTIVEQNIYPLTVNNGSVMASTSLCTLLSDSSVEIQDAINEIYNSPDFVTSGPTNYINLLIDEIWTYEGYDSSVIDKIDTTSRDGIGAANQTSTNLSNIIINEGCAFPFTVFYPYNPIVIAEPTVIDKSLFENTLTETIINLLGVELINPIRQQLSEGENFFIANNSTSITEDMSIAFVHFNDISTPMDFMTGDTKIYYGYDLLREDLADNNEVKITWDGEHCGQYILTSSGPTISNHTSCPTGDYIMLVSTKINQDGTNHAIQLARHFTVIESMPDLVEDAFPMTITWETPFLQENFIASDPVSVDGATTKNFTYNTIYNIDLTDSNNQEFTYLANIDDFYYSLNLVALNSDGTINSTIKILDTTENTDSPIVTLNWNELCGAEECNPELDYVLKFINDPTDSHRTIHSVPLALIFPDETLLEAPTVEITSPENGYLFAEEITTINLAALTGDTTATCKYDANPDFVFNTEGTPMSLSGPFTSTYTSNLEVEAGNTYEITIKCSPFGIGPFTDDQIGSSTIRFSVASDEALCTYLEDNRDAYIEQLDTVFRRGPGDGTATIIGNIIQNNPTLRAATQPTQLTSGNYQDHLNEWVDFFNDAIPDDCDVEEIDPYDFSDPEVPEVTINQPDEDGTTGTSITVEVGTDLDSVCKASLNDLDFDDDDEDNLEMDVNSDGDEFELVIDDLEQGETTIYVKCANKDNESKIGEAEVTFTVGENVDTDISCKIEADKDEFDPSTEDIEFTYSIENNEDVEKVDYTLVIQTDSGTEVTELKTDRNEDLDLEDLTRSWNGLIEGDRLVDGDYKAVLTAEDSDDGSITCSDQFEFELDDSLVDGIVLEINTLNSVFEPSTSHADLELINRIDGDRVVLNAYGNNAAPISTVFYQCASGQGCPESAGELRRGTHDLIWDGIDSSGRYVMPGDYFFKASLKDENDNIFVAFSDPVEARGVVGPGGPAQPPLGGSCSFADVPPIDADFQAVQWACQNGIFMGSNGVMNMNQPLLRVDFIAVANRLAACPPTTYNPQIDGNLSFIDLNEHINIPSRYWFMSEIKNASRTCIARGQTINGNPDNTIRINDQIVAAELWKVSIEAAKNGNRANYTFAANPNQDPWYADYQALLQTNSVPLAPPAQGMTRRDAIRLLHNMYLRGLIR